jgi:fructokinase
MRKVYGIGETVLDIIFKDGEPRAAKPGGSSLNCCVSLGRLGLDVEFISEYGNDPVGDMIDSFLKDNNVKTNYVTRFSDGKSALALAFLDEHNNASYTFYKDFPADRLKNIPDKTSHEDIVSFCSIYAITRAVRPNLMKFVTTAKANRSVIIYDPNFRAAHLHELEELRPYIIENLKMADLVRASDEDMKNIFRVTDPIAAYQCIKDYCPVLIYTANTKEVTVLAPSGTFSFPVKSIKPVSTIGAGDNFNAGIICAMLRDNIRKEMLQDLTQEQWGRVIETGVDFATEVCMKWENYISMEFVGNYVKKHVRS